MKKEKRAAKPDAAEVLAENQARDTYAATVRFARAKYQNDLKLAKDHLSEALATKSTEYQRNLMREHHKEYHGGSELEKDPDFIGWLDRRDARGYEIYEMKCSYCNGRAKKNCGRCRETGRLQFPRYCKDCDDMLPHGASVVCVH